MKKVLSVMLVFIMLFSSTVFANAEETERFTEGFYTYTVENGKATIVDADRNNLIGEIVTPTTLGGYPVIAIGDWSMDSCDNITILTISEGVEVLGDHSLYSCYKLRKVNLPSTLRRIESNALRNNGALEELILPDGLEFIGEDIISYNSKITRVDIPESVKKIGFTAFLSIPSIKDVYIYTKDAEIGEYAFGYWEFGLKEGHTLEEAIDIMNAHGDAFLEGDEAKLKELKAALNEIMKDYAETDEDLFIGYYMTIHGYTGSTAEAYAKANNIKFVSLDDEPTADEPTTEEPDIPEKEDEPCSCICHATGLWGLFYKIIYTVQKFTGVNLIEKVFTLGQFCKCETAHY